MNQLVACPLGGYFRLVYLSLFIASPFGGLLRSFGSPGRSTPPLSFHHIKAPWARDSPSSELPVPHRMSSKQRFFFLVPWTIVFSLLRDYGRS